MSDERVEQEMKKRLRNLHPLYKRLSGDVLWELFTECGCTDEQCGVKLDASIAQMHETLAVMQKLEAGEAVGFVYTAEKDTLCSQCDFLRGKKVLGAQFEVLPPFAVGCSLSCRALEGEEADLVEADVTSVAYRLCCDFI